LFQGSEKNTGKVCLAPAAYSQLTLIKKFLIYKEIQMGAVAKSQGLSNILYEEMCKYIVIYQEAVYHL
jgi:hypothetical protein